MDFKLNQNYPNPFNPSTTISFNLNKTSEVKLAIYDALGRLVQVLLDNKLQEGNYDVEWNGKNYSGTSVGSGVYIYKIIVKAENKLFSQSKKMTLVK
jgi:flagellar hook assembly protein FlgD